MRFLMLISADRNRADAWLGLTPDEQEAAEAPLREWFERHAAGGHIESGHELAFPRDAVSIRSGPTGPVAVHEDESGPALLSGVIVLETDTVEEAVEIAASWPDLTGPADRVVLVPVRGYDP